MDATSNSGGSISRLSVDKPIDPYRKELKPKKQEFFSFTCKKELAEIEAIKADWQQSVKAIDKNFEKIKNSMENIIQLLDKIDNCLKKNEDSSDESIKNKSEDSSDKSIEKKYASISDLKIAAVSVNTATDGAMKKTKNLISTIKRTNVNQFDGNNQARKLFTQLGNEANKLSKLIISSTDPVISKSHSKKKISSIENKENKESLEMKKQSKKMEDAIESLINEEDIKKNDKNSLRKNEEQNNKIHSYKNNENQISKSKSSYLNSSSEYSDNEDPNYQKSESDGANKSSNENNLKKSYVESDVIIEDSVEINQNEESDIIIDDTVEQNGSETASNYNKNKDISNLFDDTIDDTFHQSKANSSNEESNEK